MKKSGLLKKIILELIEAPKVKKVKSTTLLGSLVKQFINQKTAQHQISERQLYDTFTYLHKQGLIEIRESNNQIFISLTEEGKAKAGKYQIDDLKITQPRHWDKRWRILIFDIPEDVKIKREALRGKLKELNFFQLQKSVWLHPYECFKELELLRQFFGLANDQMVVINTGQLGRVESKVKAFYSSKKKYKNVLGKS